MAKVVLTFDTIDKTAVATIDGAEVPNFSSFNVYKGYKGKCNMEITSGVEDEDNDMRAWTRVCASEGGDLVEKGNELNPETEAEVKKFFCIDE